MSELGLFEAMYTTSGVVDIKPDPVEKEKIERVLDAAIRAPSGSNTQPWEFVVVRDPDLKARVKKCVLEGAQVHLSVMNAIHMKSPSGKRRDGMARKFAFETDQCPVLIFVCLNKKKFRLKTKKTLSAALKVLRNPGFLHFMRLCTCFYLPRSAESNLGCERIRVGYSAQHVAVCLQRQSRDNPWNS